MMDLYLIRMSRRRMRKPVLSRWTQSAESGQGGLIAVAITIMIALVLGATTLSGMSMLNASRTVAMKQTLQTYYAAQAGIQEAIATRMVPRSNYLNFNTASTKEYYSRSGLIYTDPSKVNDAAPTQGVVAMYRYVVVGGDSARKADSSYYASTPTADWETPQDVPRLLSNDTMPPDSAFVVISNGLTCKAINGRAMVATDQLQLSPTPSCKDTAKYTLDQITLVARVKLAQEYPGSNKPMDKVDQLRYYKNSAQLRLPVNAFLPGYGWWNANQTFDFQKVWAYSSVADTNESHNPLTLEKVVFYNFADNQIFYEQDVTSNVVSIGTKIPSKSVIRLYFNGPIDHRSISPTYNQQLSDCQGTGATTCRIRVMQNADAAGNGGTAYAGNTMIPLFPGGTQVILLPPLTGTIPGGGVRHAIRVDASKMAGYNGAAGPKDYRIIFTTQ